MLNRLVITALSFICISSTTQAGTITQHDSLVSTDINLSTADERYADLTPNVRSQIKKEVHRFRISAKALDQERRELQKSLSKEAQVYLKSEQRFRRQVLEVAEGETGAVNSTSTELAHPYKKIIKDFNDNIANFDADIRTDIRHEIRDYRKLLLEIRQRKRRLYNNLSLEAQEYLTEAKKSSKRLANSIE